MEDAAKRYPSRQLGMAFSGNDALNENQYGGALYYRPPEQRIMTQPEFDMIMKKK